jgi:uncharacterized protein
MASVELLQLHKLHQIDVGLLEVKKKAGALEAGKKFQAELEKIKQDFETKSAEFHRLHGEQKDLELSNQQIEDKLKSIENQLFSGKVTNAKEVEAFEAQKKTLIKQREKNDDQILLLWDEVPPVQKLADEAKKVFDQKNAQFEEWQKKATVYRQQLESQHKQLTAKRPELVATIQAGLLARYEAIKKTHGGIGMASVTKDVTCEECGTHVAEMQIVSLKEDRTVQCEECQRILYFTGGFV